MLTSAGKAGALPRPPGARSMSLCRGAGQGGPGDLLEAGGPGEGGGKLCAEPRLHLRPPRMEIR